jgi:hypothetical protein
MLMEAFQVSVFLQDLQGLPINNQCHPSKANLPKRRHLGTGVATCSLWIIEGEPVWTHKMLDDFGVFIHFMGIYIYIRIYIYTYIHRFEPYP